MTISRMQELGHLELAQLALNNMERQGRRYVRGHGIGSFVWSNTPEGEGFWKYLNIVGENGIEDMYDAYPQYLKPLEKFKDQKYKVRTNGLFAVKQ